MAVHESEEETSTVTTTSKFVGPVLNCVKLGASIKQDGNVFYNPQETESDNTDNESSSECPTTVHIENSNDVVIGTVTQFHGPVTIVQTASVEHIGMTSNQHDPGKKYINNPYGKQKFESRNLDKEDTFLPPLKSCYTITRQNVILIAICFLLLAIIALLVFIYIILPAIDSQTFHHKTFTREDWGGVEPNYTRPLRHPVDYVIISHTAGIFCRNFASCAEQMLIIQSYHMRSGSPDIGYNFLIGGDGNIYVGRDWDAINFQDDLCIGISFMGNFMQDQLTPSMIDATKQLIQQGIDLGKVAADYRLVSHNQTWNTLSPGIHVYRHIKTWSHFIAGTKVSWNVE